MNKEHDLESSDALEMRCQEEQTKGKRALDASYHELGLGAQKMRLRKSAPKQRERTLWKVGLETKSGQIDQGTCRLR
jgi:hypothetical protein